MKRHVKWMGLALAVTILGNAGVAMAATNSQDNCGSNSTKGSAWVQNIDRTKPVASANRQDYKTGSNWQGTEASSVMNIKSIANALGIDTQDAETVLNLLAGNLGMTPQSVLSALNHGMTISDLAAQRGMTVSQLRNKILKQLEQQEYKNCRPAYNKLEQCFNSRDWVKNHFQVGQQQQQQQQHKPDKNKAQSQRNTTERQN